ncbi:hypothetical protein EH240_09820 [Mesorhizobium tamadayense]|uniref:Uncharacterized protein n=1 Tax=Mesorhizobium tamadayense TaxID=425306 RepID=A0A3P3FYP8_9HYPH|nr:hypothetical protein [Mesorhizobium tamadayense]RRI03587.1 hypothetical protein EH240_09820 [Mesorhizobium tamadayense]
MRTLADKVRICAANNADLYEAVFRALGLREHRNPFMWWSESPAPPFYSNLTTLDPDAIEPQLKAVKQLSSVLEGPFAVKDGFCRLDLGDVGFKLLFDASWIWADPDRAIDNTGGRMAAGWQRICDADALRAWENAWASDNPTDQRVFPPAILDNPDVAFLGRAATDGFDAGCIVNRSLEVVGLSNVFAKGKDVETVYQDATSATFTYANDLPLVGYEHDDALRAARIAGFEPIGNLRIWLQLSEGTA